MKELQGTAEKINFGIDLNHCRLCQHNRRNFLNSFVSLCEKKNKKRMAKNKN